MRREDLYLNDIVEATDHIAAFIAGVDFDAFMKSEMMRSAVVQKLAIIGEAAARLPEDAPLWGPMAPNCSFSEHSDSRLLRNRLGRGLAIR